MFTLQTLPSFFGVIFGAKRRYPLLSLSLKAEYLSFWQLSAFFQLMTIGHEAELE